MCHLRPADSDDQVGSVIAETEAGGERPATHHADAWENSASFTDGTGKLCDKFRRRALALAIFVLITFAVGIASIEPSGTHGPESANSESLDFKFRLHRLQESQTDGLSNLLKIMSAIPADHVAWNDPNAITLTRIDRASYQPWHGSVVIRYDSLQRRLGGYRLKGGESMPTSRSMFERMLVEALEGPVGADGRTTLVVSYRSGDEIHLVEFPFYLGLSIEELRATRSQGILDVEAARLTPLGLDQVLGWIIHELFEEQRSAHEEPSEVS